MGKKRKFCFCINSSRVIGTALVAISAVNMSIVGVAFKESLSYATPTSLPPTQDLTATFKVPSATDPPAVITSNPAETPSLTSSPTFTVTTTTTPTATLTSTSTYTLTPTSTHCAPWSYWPVYHVQSGDTLYSLALLTGTTVYELKLANCLPGTLIITGQLLYVPRLPVRSPTPTWTHPPEPDLPPVVKIISARVNSTYVYDGYDGKLGLSYTYVILDGEAVDSEDGVLPSSSLIWSTDRIDIYPNPFLGTGNSVRAVLYSNECTGVWHTITLTATDSMGHVAVASIKIFIGSNDCQVGIDRQGTWML